MKYSKWVYAQERRRAIRRRVRGGGAQRQHAIRSSSCKNTRASLRPPIRSTDAAAPMMIKMKITSEGYMLEEEARQVAPQRSQDARDALGRARAARDDKRDHAGSARAHAATRARHGFTEATPAQRCRHAPRLRAADARYAISHAQLPNTRQAGNRHSTAGGRQRRRRRHAHARPPRRADTRVAPLSKMMRRYELPTPSARRRCGRYGARGDDKMPATPVSI